jgi:hypothetical protein
MVYVDNNSDLLIHWVLWAVQYSYISELTLEVSSDKIFDKYNNFPCSNLVIDSVLLFRTIPRLKFH